MKFFKNLLLTLEEYKRLSLLVNKKCFPLGITGLSSIHKAHIVHSLSSQKNKKAFLIVFDEYEANRVANDLMTMGSKALIYPIRDFSFYDIEGQSFEYTHQRLEVLSSIVNKDFDVVIFCIDAGLQFTIPKEKFLEEIFTISTSESLNIENISNKLLDLGYENCDEIEGIGQFTHRGGIIDIFPVGYKNPVRIELWGDEIDTISYFDIKTQRRFDSLDSINIVPASEIILDNKNKLIKKIENHIKTLRGKYASKAKEILYSEIEKIENNIKLKSQDKFISLIYEKPNTLFDYISKNDLLFISEPTKVKDRFKSFSWQWSEDLKSYLESGILCKGLDKYSEDYIYAVSKFESFKTIYLDSFVHKNYSLEVKEMINFTTIQLSAWSGSLDYLCEDLESTKSKNSFCIILAGTDKAAQSLTKDLQHRDFQAEYHEDIDNLILNKIIVMPGSLSAGFEYPSINIKLITHGYFHKPKSKKSNYKKGKNIYNLSELSIGDHVVHSSHGIGVFNGVRKLEMNGVIKDYITLTYSKGDNLYVPVTQLDLISKYVGSKENVHVKLNRLGSSEWKKTKAKVRSNVKDIAEHLIELYSERIKIKGYAFSEDNEWQKDFERHFEYEETQDQLRCIDEIKLDMEQDMPMDRLLCGDVGFGKTEVALRAAFKCVCDSKQCVMLVPTTILAWQHYQTISRRFEGFPVKIELLSRFKTTKQQSEILKKLKRGEVDIIVGTHRLVQKDVVFKDLGLAIIDEEQRFGVKQKEHFKNMFKNIDILTLSATPIPRTLNMALSGIRDMSTLEEAPQDRYPVQTYVLEYDSAIIKEAILKELRRGGQVYYLHNKVESIDRVASKLRAILPPEAKIGVGHGKMSENELSDVWKQVIDQEINVLVCTTIIETGVDLPNVNTLIIEDADHMGLSQLHQIRGRVGRSSRRAYAYFTFKRNKVLTEISQKRLSAVREFTEFGSGYKIALRDLELRGAGNILGGQQHGNIADVGYEMYVKLLNEAINEKKGEKPVEDEKECLIDIQVSSHIPEDYISNLGQRIDMYRKIAGIKDKEDVSDVIDELIDRFGELPKVVKKLIDIALIRSFAKSRNIFEIRQNLNSILLFQEKIDLNFVSELIKRFGNRVMVNAGSKPYIAIKTENKESLIELLKKCVSF